MQQSGPPCLIGFAAGLNGLRKNWPFLPFVTIIPGQLQTF